MWRLSDEEALKVIRTHDPTWPSLFASDKALIKATLRKVYEEIEKRGICLLSKDPCWGFSEQDMKELKQEAGL